MSDCRMTERPGYTGALNATILARVRVMAEALAMPDLEARFPHLTVTDGSWRKPAPEDKAIAIGQHIDHTLLKAAATSAEIAALCAEAKVNKFKAICVNGCRVAQSAELLAGSGVLVACVCGFPLGQMTGPAKAVEALEECRNGASEIDMVMNIGAMKDKDYKAVYADIKAVHDACAAGKAILKVIFETCLLTDEEIIDACVICVAVGAEFVKTSTGFSTSGSTPEGVDIMLAAVGNAALVKAAGGVRNYATALEYVKAGVARIGTSSSISIAAGGPAAGGAY